MTSTNAYSGEQEKTTQMAEALIKHLGTAAAASVFVDRQLCVAEGTAFATWTAIAAHLERYRTNQ